MSERPYRQQAALVILGVVVLAMLAAIAGLVYAFLSGQIASDVTIQGDVTITGTINLTWLFLGIGGGVVAIVYIAAKIVFGERLVEESVDEIENKADDN